MDRGTNNNRNGVNSDTDTDHSISVPSSSSHKSSPSSSSSTGGTTGASSSTPYTSLFCGIILGIGLSIFAFAALGSNQRTDGNSLYHMVQSYSPPWSRNGDNHDDDGNDSGGSVSKADYFKYRQTCSDNTLKVLKSLQAKSKTGPAEGYPITIDLIHSVDECVKPSKLFPYGLASPVAAKEDICYVTVVTDGSLGFLRTQNSTWVSVVPYDNFVAIGGQADPTLRLITFPDIDGAANHEWARMMTGLKHLITEPEFAHCKWFFIGSDAAWVNPRVVQEITRGLYDNHPLVLGFQWNKMGWSHGVTYSAGLTLLTRTAVQNIVPLLNQVNPIAQCTNRTDDFILDACGWESQAVYVHELAVEPLGELGPGGSWSWQQPHHLMSWISVKTTNPNFHLRLLWQYFTEIYGNGPDNHGFAVENVAPYKV